MRQHVSAFVSIRQHTSAYVSIRPHTSTYVSIRKRMSIYCNPTSTTGSRKSAYVNKRQQYVSILHTHFYRLKKCRGTLVTHHFSQQDFALSHPTVVTAESLSLANCPPLFTVHSGVTVCVRVCVCVCVCVSSFLNLVVVCLCIFLC